MHVDPDDIRDRLQVVHLEDALSFSEGATVYAEDPKAECIGLGAVEAEAVGNAISVVIKYEREQPSGAPYVKSPGQVGRRSWPANQPTVFERLREFL